MGGYNSGRPQSTAKIDESLKLDINKLKRDGTVGLNLMRSGHLTWTNISTGKEIASVNYQTNTFDFHDMWLRLHYRYTPCWDDKPINVDYKIKLVTTQPNYGGERLWFICPFTQKRCSILYNPPGCKEFASRYAFNLKYQSQSKSARDRILDRMWKLKRKLGGEDYWHKPKGMHQKTYEQILDKINAEEEICDTYITQLML